MKGIILAAALLLAAMPAAAGKDCEELKGEIEKKIAAKGVKAFTLEVVAKGEEGDRKVVGSCGGGTKRIVYKRGK